MSTAKKRQAAIPFILITLLLDVLGIGLIIPVLPKLVTHFQGGDVSSASWYYGVFVASYAVMQFLFAPILGGLSDTYGRRPIILLSLAGAGFDYVLMAMAPSLGWLFLGRVLSGIKSANLTAASAYIADVSPPEKRAQNFGLMGACFGIGFVLGPAAGGLLGSLGPRVPFVAAAILTLCNALYGLFVLPESHAVENRRPFSWKSANPIGSLAVLRSYPLVIGLAGTLLCAGFAQQILQSTWVLYTTYRFSWTELQNGLSLSVVGITAAVVQGGLTRVLTPKLGERGAVVVGLLVAVVAFVGYGAVPEGWMLYAVLVFGSLGGIAMPAAQALISKAVSPTEQGKVQGALASLQSLTGIVGPLVATSLLGYFTSSAAPLVLPGAAFYLGALLMLGGALLAIRSYRHLPAEPRAAPALAE